MNWSSVTFDWNHVRAFLATVEEGSLSAAARVLRLTQPTLGRQVAALEDSLGVVLFERVGRGLVLTPAGTELLDNVRAMADAAGRISLTASGQSQAIEGQVCITASDAMSAFVLPPLLGKLRALAPGITIDVVAANDIRDLQRREADIAIRHLRPEQPDLIARRIRDSTGHFYASKDYINARGHPLGVADRHGHDFIGYQPVERFIAELARFGVTLAKSDLKLLTESGVTAWEMVKQGLGIGVMLKEIGDMTPNVDYVFVDLPPVPVPIWLTAHRELMTSRRIRLVYDFLAEELARPQPAAIARSSSR